MEGVLGIVTFSWRKSNSLYPHTNEAANSLNMQYESFLWN